MNCKLCGAELVENALICSKCGCAAGNTVKTRMNKREFLNSPEMKLCKMNLLSSVIVLYFSSVITILLSVTKWLGGEYPTSLLDAAIVLVLAVWMHIGKSRICAILTTLYGLCNVIYMYLQTGKFAGWLILLAGIVEIYYTFMLQKAWKEYERKV